MRCEERLRQQEIENVQLRSELRTLARSEDVARVEASVFERVQTMVGRRLHPAAVLRWNVKTLNLLCLNYLQVGKALEHDSDSVASLVEQNATMRRMWQEDRANLFKMRDMQLDLHKAMDAALARLAVVEASEERSSSFDERKTSALAQHGVAADARLAELAGKLQVSLDFFISKP
jgi:hypothetical protein